FEYRHEQFCLSLPKLSKLPCFRETPSRRIATRQGKSRSSDCLLRQRGPGVCFPLPADDVTPPPAADWPAEEAGGVMDDCIPVRR
ncbi:hypothetical protein LSAT2_028774, partial [Lamellibrachia satsuma]